MKMKKLLLIGITVFCLIHQAYSQNDTLYGYYYADNTRHYWVEDHTSLNIIVNNLNHFDSIVARLGSIFNDDQDEILADNEDNNIIVNSGSLAVRNISDIITAISLSSNDIAFTTYAKRINGNPIWLTNEVYVKLKNNAYYTTHIQPILSQYSGVASYYEGNNEYKFVCQTDTLVVTLANKLYDTAYVVYSSPDFYSLGVLLTNDPYFNDQWNLKNTGQSGGVIGVDIKAEEAWAFLQKAIGASGGNVKVAVIDDGVEEHEDFYEGGGICMVLEGYTANGDGTGRPRPKNKHGECCAGIIAAVHNNIGLAGVAPHSRIVPIRIFRNVEDGCFFYFFPMRKIARAITKSWEDYDASVLNCSWRLPSPNDLVVEAINRASTEGRGGKGCIVVFASGNRNDSIVSYPSGLEKVLSVGSIDKNGYRSNFSNYGSELDLSAPGEVIITTDRMGDYGFSNNQMPEPNYITDFTGTSAACPHVSGVAALMLSVNPNLTREQVFFIMENTGQKVGGYNYGNNNNHPNGTWNQKTGYGLVDAHMAVVQSFLFGHNVYVNGPNSFTWNPCEDYIYSLNIPHPEYFTYNWSCSSNLTILSSNLNTISVIANGNGTGYIIVDVYSEGRKINTYSKDINVTSSYYSMGLSPISINTNTNWTYNNYALFNDVIVEPDVTLTITGTVFCSEQCCLKVKPRGRLIINGGRLTNLCSEELWQGIEVWGDSCVHQDMTNGAYGQGYLELKNGAVIENAVCAVELWHPGDPTSTGGIIHASDATFHNNAMAVRAERYTNHDPITQEEDNYHGWFHNCTFSVDQNYLGTEPFNQHVFLSHNRGIRFKGCAFSVVSDAPNVSSTSKGINAADAGFTVKSYCGSNGQEYNTVPCPSEYLIRSSFTGFHDGVYSTSAGVTTRTFSVRDAVFSMNMCGIYAKNTGLATIIGNSFSVGYKSDCSYGVYVDHVSGFCIEENTFTTGIDESVNCGIGVFGCAGGNDIYLNTFDGLDCGNLAVGQNYTRMGSLSGGTITSGLTYTCNQNSDNAIDFCVLKEDGIGGVYPTQGSSSSPAGNTFDGDEYHFYNDGNNTLDYYYYSGDSYQVPNTTLVTGVNRISTVSRNRCLTHYGGVVRSPEEKAELARRYHASDDWHERYQAAGDIVRSNLNESHPDLAELRTWLGNMGDVASGHALVASYAETGDFDGAMALAATLPERYGLEGNDLADHADYMVLLGIHKTLHDTHRTTGQMTEVEKGTVEGIAMNGRGFSQSLAKVILDRAGGENSDDIQCRTLPDNPLGSKGSYGVGKQQDEDFTIAIAPNPASTWANVEYTLPAGCSAATLSIMNSLGVEVMTVALQGAKGTKVVGLERLPQGVYGYTVRTGNHVIDGKLVIMR